MNVMRAVAARISNTVICVVVVRILNITVSYYRYPCSGGTPSSYCGLTDHDVCCFIPDNAAPVGILPAPSAGQCGK